MKKHIKSFTLAMCFAISMQTAIAADQIKALNGVAMEVNAAIITYGDIDKAVRVLKSNPASKNIPETTLVESAKQKLVERAMMVEAAKNMDLKINTAEIDAEINRRALAGKMNPNQLYAQAAALGWGKEAYRLEVAKDLLAERVLAGVLEGAKVSDGQIQQYISQAQKDGKKLPEGSPYTVYEVRRILLKINDQNRNTVGDRMKMIAHAIQRGGDFGAYAKRYSQEAAAAQNGVIEIAQDSEPEAVEAMLNILKAGQISSPIQTTQNWQMIQMINQKTETNPEKMQREAVRRQLLAQEQQKLYAQFLGQLQQSTVVRERTL